MKILILVLSCNDNGIYSKFFESQKNTWDSIDVEGVETFYFFGDHDKNEIIDNKILVDVKEVFVDPHGKSIATNAGLKTLKTFELIQNMEFDYVFRTNSSSYIDKKLLHNYIVNKPITEYYSGVIGHHGNIVFASGSGFFLSKDLIKLLVDNKEKWDHTLIDDVLIGSLLKNFNISPQPNPRFDVVDSNIPSEYFHYRLKNKNRDSDIQYMYQIKNIKEKN